MKMIYNSFYYFSISKKCAGNLDLHDCTYACLIVYLTCILLILE